MRRPLRWLAAAALVTALGAGCGDDDDAPTDDTVENAPEVDGGETPDDTTDTGGADAEGGSGGTQGNQQVPGEEGTTLSTARGAGG
jgi:predicted small lipoprotein YifL